MENKEKENKGHLNFGETMMITILGLAILQTIREIFKPRSKEKE